MKPVRYGLLTFVVTLIWVLGHQFILLGPGRPGVAATLNPSEELRGVWITNVDSEVFFSPDALTGAIDRLATNHFNTLYPAVWSWGYTLYPSEVAARATGYAQGIYPDLEAEGRNETLEATQADRDVLQELITQSHAHNMGVIPWFEFSFMLPSNCELAKRHPEWLTQKQGYGESAQLYQEGRHTRVWMNPFHPEVQQFLLDLIAEMAQNYDIDGLQLDDHFGLPVAFGYDPYTVELYRQEHGGYAPPANPYDAEWMRWRAAKITEFLDRVFHTVKRYRPKAVISVSPNPARFAYNHYLQDWPNWQQMGYIEELVIQAYRDSVGGFDTVLQDPLLVRARNHIPTAVGILTGLKDSPVSMNLISRQVEQARARGYAGVSFFFYDTLWSAAGEREADREATVRTLFTAPSERPAVAASR